MWGELGAQVAAVDLEGNDHLQAAGRFQARRGTLLKMAPSEALMTLLSELPKDLTVSTNGGMSIRCALLAWLQPMQGARPSPGTELTAAASYALAAVTGLPRRLSGSEASLSGYAFSAVARACSKGMKLEAAGLVWLHAAALCCPGIIEVYRRLYPNEVGGFFGRVDLYEEVSTIESFLKVMPMLVERVSGSIGALPQGHDPVLAIHQAFEKIGFLGGLEYLSDQAQQRQELWDAIEERHCRMEEGGSPLLGWEARRKLASIIEAKTLLSEPELRLLVGACEAIICSDRPGKEKSKCWWTNDALYSLLMRLLGAVTPETIKTPPMITARIRSRGRASSAVVLH